MGVEWLWLGVWPGVGEDPHPLFGGLQRLLTEASQTDAAFEGRKRVLKRHLALLQGIDDGFQLGQ